MLIEIVVRPNCFYRLAVKYVPRCTKCEAAYNFNTGTWLCKPSPLELLHCSNPDIKRHWSFVSNSTSVDIDSTQVLFPKVFADWNAKFSPAGQDIPFYRCLRFFCPGLVSQPRL